MRSVVAQGWSVSTPVGRLSVVVDGEVVIASAFCDLADLVQEVAGDVEVRAPEGPVADAVREYLAGSADALERVDVRQPGGPFFQATWRAMREIPAGQTWSYRELATKAGNPDAVRAAGSACARNQVAPFVPCHRVVRSDGTLGGYAFGLDVKRWLLTHERGHVPGE